MNRPKVVSREEWLVARNELLAKEKELTRAQDALSAERRRLPMVRIEKEYVFEGPDGKATLPDLFEGRRQLALYHFMLGPSQEEGCDGCSMVVDNMGHPAHLRDGDEVYHTYFTDRRGVEYLGSSFSYFDLAPYGRQEDWEDSPEGWPKGPRYTWWRHHDRYDDQAPSARNNTSGGERS